LPYPRFNAVLVAAPRGRMDEVVKQVTDLDRPTAPGAQAKAFPLKKAPASRVGTLIQNFYQSRYAGTETLAQNQIRITWDDSINTVFVQAAPADLAEISELIERIDSSVSSAVNEIRIIPLRNALADEIATLIVRAISQGVQPGAPGAPGIVPTAAPGLGAAGLPGAGLGAAAGLGGLGAAAAGPLGAATRQGTTPGPPTTGATGGGTAGTTSKSTTLRFISAMRDGKVVESGLLEDVRLTPDVRTNTIIVSAPAKTVELIQSLIQSLDVPPAARAEINIFTLRRADAVQMANTIQQ